MKKLMHLFAGTLLAFILVLIMIPATVKAQGKTYTVAFRSGNAGKFDTSVVSAMIPGAKVSRNYIKLEIERGMTLKDTYPGIFGTDDALNDFLSNQAVLKTEKAKGGYYKVLRLVKAAENEVLKTDTISVDEKIENNKDVILTYSRIVDPAKYVIEYVRGDTGADVAAPVYGIGEDGEKITRSPLTIKGYHIVADASTVTLKSGSTAEIRFKYSIDERTVYETEVIYTQGDTVYNNVVNRVVQTAGAATRTAGAATQTTNANAAGNNEVVVPDAETPLANNGNDASVIEDKNKSSTDTEKIKDEKTPLADKGIMSNTALFVMSVIIAILVLLATSVAFVMTRKGRNDGNDRNHRNEKL